MGCNSNSDKEKELLQKEIELLKQEKELLALRSKTKEIPQEPMDKQEGKKKINNNYLIGNNAAGKFKIGNQIPYPETADDYTLKKETQTRMTEEGPEAETVYLVKENSNDVLNIKPEYNFQTGEYTQNIGEIMVLSSLFQTFEGIGVNATIEEFIKTYPDYKIWYTYVSGMYVMETKAVNAQFILNEKDFIGKIKVNSDQIDLKKSDFKSTGKIIKIRII
ncbi:hypothetical protein DNU06_04430 [Putridiphycobacter roseus]|uniref:Uncharacterized protein n=2 Tax=Putridiphycobacter roseus TaxID=2219161 RepID=A0A2W1N2V2_9FLAO|nr:hypothetical protein DNU06_04430 [Putridiphycobacter roseus]